jgi:hypothetical protein
VKPLPLDALKFAATRSSSKDRDGNEYLHLTLRYFVVHKGVETTLLLIRLDDTKPLTAIPAAPSDDGYLPREDRLPFWFYYQPVLQRWDRGQNIQRLYPSIDLIVFSSVKVTIERVKEELDKFQSISFEGVPPDSRSPDDELSPVRPKISLRRVHNPAQIPMLGTPFNLQLLKPDFSFYVDGKREPRFTTRTSLFDLISKREPIDPEDLLLPRRTWTRVFFDEQYSEFNFLESSYRIRVYDQHFDLVDGKLVMNDEDSVDQPQTMSLDEAHAKKDAASKLISLPKYLQYELGLDPTKVLMADDQGRGYVVDYRPLLKIAKSQNIHLVGTLDRDSQFDRITNSWMQEFQPNVGQDFRGTNYRDYLPSLRLTDENGKEIRYEGLERSSSGPASYRFEKSAARKYLEFQFSLIIGFTPILGEAFGLYELYTAVTEGKDAFGNRLTDTEKVIVGIAAILPFIGPTIKGFRSLPGDVFPFLANLVKERRFELAKIGNAL